MITDKDKIHNFVMVRMRDFLKDKSPDELLQEVRDWEPPEKLGHLKPILLKEMQRWIEKFWVTT